MKLLPAPVYAWLKATAKRYLPKSVKEWIKRNILRSGSASLRSRDLMLQILEQRCENLETHLVERVDALEQRVVDEQSNTLQRQDEVLVLFEQRLERFEQSLIEAEGRNSRLLGDVASDQLQEEFHDPERLREEYSYLIGEFVPEGGVFLDVGCGSGTLLEQSKESGREAKGIDNNPEAIRICQAKDLHAVEAEAVQYLEQAPTKSLDAIFALHIIEHLTNSQLRSFLQNAHRILKPEGVLLMETPKISSLCTLSEYYFVDPTHLAPRHHNLYRFATIDAGFEIVELNDVVRTDGTGGEKRLDTGFGELLSEGDRSTDGSVAVGTDPQLALLASRLDENFERLREWLLVPRDVRIVARKG